MIVLALEIALGTLAAGLLAALVVRRLPTLRLQLAALALVAVLLPLAAVVTGGYLMFSSDHDLEVLVVSAGAATAALVVALLVASSIAGALDRLRSSSRLLAGGDLAARAPEQGPAEVADVARAFNEMAESLEQLFDARRELVAWASHDLRTPLASMQAMLEALEDGIAEPAHYLPAMREQVAVLSMLVEDLFELARIDAGALTLELREWPLPALVESCLRGVEAEAHARHIRLAAEFDDSERPVRIDPEKVERVLYNLLTNALRHTPSDGAVAVRVGTRDGEVRVEVVDSGEGLDADAARRMFERFWRGDRARSGGGAGLGLAIARGLIEAHGGRIWAESVPGGGARVSFTLPA